MAFMKVERIEDEAVGLIAAYGASVAPIVAPPIPVAEVFECHLKFNLQFADLRKKHGDSKVLAEIYILSKKVVVDQSLDPDAFPANEGRFNFTLAHEIGHWMLHRHDVIAVADIPDLFGDVPPPVICRDFSVEPHEWQANQFASFFLMPTAFVLEAWTQVCPNGGAINVHDEIKKKRARFRVADTAQDPVCDVVRMLAPQFHVSFQAMQRRLKDMKLLDFNNPTADLI